ncbi:MAG: hypothetical protein NTV58_19030 [Deltaproteobacteria bacterium]|nr:hypothetical protein [Deltaproteobacteria bacterium]
MNIDDITAIMENRYSIDCVQMMLEPQLAGTVGKAHRGMGFISQDPDGSFSLKMYCIGDISPQDVFARSFDWKAGELIHEDYYYKLTASDIRGRQWEAKWIIPDISLGPEPQRYIVGGNIGEFSHSTDLSHVSAYYAGIYIPGNISIPCGMGSAIEKMVNGQQRSLSTNLNIAKFSACNIDFEIEKNVNWLIINVQSNAPINDALLVRIIESLQFVLAKSLSWSIIELIHDKTIKVRIRPCLRNDNKSRIEPPIQFQSVDPSNKVWTLFGKFLNHTKQYDKLLWHPIFRWIRAVIESGYSLDAESLMLSVAIEGLIRERFNNLDYRNAELQSQINKARCVITRSELEPDFKNRIFSLLGNMLKPRAKDSLHILKDQNLLDVRLLEEYSKLRNSSAHGELADSSKFQVHLDRCAAVLVLFYHLVFIAINYSGPYTDYSSRNYPEKGFTIDTVLSQPSSQP